MHGKGQYNLETEWWEGRVGGAGTECQYFQHFLSVSCLTSLMNTCWIFSSKNNMILKIHSASTCEPVTHLITYQNISPITLMTKHYYETMTRKFYNN